MSTAPTFGPQVLGQTEKPLNAILDRQLAGTGLTGPQWVTLSLAVVSGEPVDREQLIRRVTGALKISEAQAQAQIAALADAGLLQTPDGEAPPVEVTEAGQQLHAQIRTAVTQITQRLWGDLPAADVATARRVLSTILARTNAELAGA